MTRPRRGPGSLPGNGSPFSVMPTVPPTWRCYNSVLTDWLQTVHLWRHDQKHLFCRHGCTRLGHRGSSAIIFRVTFTRGHHIPLSSLYRLFGSCDPLILSFSLHGRVFGLSPSEYWRWNNYLELLLFVAFKCLVWPGCIWECFMANKQQTKLKSYFLM